MRFKINEQNLKWDHYRRRNFMTVRSALGDYGVHFEKSPVPEMIHMIRKTYPDCFFLYDNKLATLYELGDLFGYGLVANEENKALENVEHILFYLSRSKITKKNRLIVMGGAITQDVGAFVAAIYLRGMPWTYIPTTLLAQSDSCIGAKTGLNFDGAKNRLGLFSAPGDVIINTEFLETLSDTDLCSGRGEILKLLVIGGSQLLVDWENKPIDQMIKAALSIKKAVIEKDEFDLGIRNSLNYGHTVGHALEVLSNYDIPHGIAVTIGMLVSNELSFERRGLSKDEKSMIEGKADTIIPLKIKGIVKNLNYQDLALCLKKDKKSYGDNIKFIIPRSIGDMTFITLGITDELIGRIVSILKMI